MFFSDLSAAAKGDLSRIKSYHLAGAPLNEIDSFGRTALHVVRYRS